MAVQIFLAIPSNYLIHIVKIVAVARQKVFRKIFLKPILFKEFNSRGYVVLMISNQTQVKIMNFYNLNKFLTLELSHA